MTYPEFHIRLQELGAMQLSNAPNFFLINGKIIRLPASVREYKDKISQLEMVEKESYPPVFRGNGVPSGTTSLPQPRGLKGE